MPRGRIYPGTGRGMMGRIAARGGCYRGHAISTAAPLLLIHTPTSP